MQTDEFDQLQEQDTEALQQTQSTQQASQPVNSSIDSHLWGYLQPCNSTLTRIDFWKIHPRYTVGRNTQANQVVLPGFKISNQHCIISWDGSEDLDSSVRVHDLSSNGTFVNGTKIGRNQWNILRDGNEIAFGTCVPQPQNGGLEDYRFIYRHTASGLPTSGLHAFYDIGTELGKGSFATVRKAVCRATGEWYAVKMIQDSKKIGVKTITFSREIAIMQKLKHPNICNLKEAFSPGNGDLYLVLELVDGGDLLEYILYRNGLSEGDAKHITYQICDALSYIHSEGVTHRDLKPENVLLTKDTPPKVKVADFGLAKLVDSATMLRTMCGTPSYLAPEVVKQTNQSGYDNAVDSWSVGVIVFSMLTNSSPFIEDENQRDIRTRILERTVDWATLHKANVTLEAQDFIRRLLEENPTQRLSLNNALQHPWLQSYRTTPKPTFSNSSHLSEMSFVSISPNSTGSSNVQPSYHLKPLQRRSYLLAQAAESGSPLPQPSEEMITNALQPDLTQSKAIHKRMRSELTPYPEAESPEHALCDIQSSECRIPDDKRVDELCSSLAPRIKRERKADEEHSREVDAQFDGEPRRSNRRAVKMRRQC
ncbi:hypothetical protein AMATHDRAFT_164241 [Amanita thiersii Skay4041]|uniref:Uncharacterized protein n=1 Tax=Amanita thiersii Skay4041 TaxID=703135 RepID=A0A2A9NBH6_9AGAR|nr:hypothetical protein AMATHDRAFT_164241 [Amanita thiersii Skay4041]